MIQKTQLTHNGRETLQIIKGKYFYGASYIQFVVRSVHELCQILSDGEDQVDPTLLLDLFSLPALEVESPEEQEVKNNEPSNKTKPPFPPPAPRRFIVQKVAGGFSVVKGPKAESTPTYLDIRIAYDIRRGNPLKKYEASDFDLALLPIATEGAQLKRRSQNNLVVAIKDPEFKISVKGFDEQRDLYVRVIPKEDADD